ncbi:hypothetical protein COBT_001456 [Conglomerata obtusa]
MTDSAGEYFTEIKFFFYAIYWYLEAYVQIAYALMDRKTHVVFDIIVLHISPAIYAIFRLIEYIYELNIEIENDHTSQNSNLTKYRSVIKHVYIYFDVLYVVFMLYIVYINLMSNFMITQIIQKLEFFPLGVSASVLMLLLALKKRSCFSNVITATLILAVILLLITWLYSLKGVIELDNFHQFLKWYIMNGLFVVYTARLFQCLNTLNDPTTNKFTYIRLFVMTMSVLTTVNNYVEIVYR